MLNDERLAEYLMDNCPFNNQPIPRTEIHQFADGALAVEWVDQIPSEYRMMVAQIVDVELQGLPKAEQDCYHTAQVVDGALREMVESGYLKQDFAGRWVGQ